MHELTEKIRDAGMICDANLDKIITEWLKEKAEELVDQCVEIDYGQNSINEILGIKEQSLEPQLGCATTKQLLDELEARVDVDGKLDYRTIDNEGCSIA